jgi:DNA-binding IclR family transcriptional regulator
MTSRELSDVTDQPDGNVRRMLAKMATAGEVEKAKRGKYRLPSISPGNIGNNGNKWEAVQ